MPETTRSILISDQVDALKSRWRSEPFQWATENECFLGVGNFVRDVTGHDPVAKWRGRYRNEAEARELISKHGLLAEFSIGMERFQTIHPDLMGQGDVGVCCIGDDELCTVFDGVYFLLKTPTGLRQIKNVRIARAWLIRVL